MQNNFEAADKNLYALIDFSKFINSSLELDFIANNLLLSCFGKFHCTKGIIIIFDENNSVKKFFAKGIKDYELYSDEIKSNNELLDSDYLIELSQKEHLVIKKEIYASEKLIGLVLLGEKLTRNEYTSLDFSILSTMLNITAISIQNSLSFEKMKALNKELNSKINQLSAIFDLGKEFSSILEIDRVGKLLVYSILGQLLVTKYAVVLFEENGINILDSKFDSEVLKAELLKINRCSLQESLSRNQFSDSLHGLENLGIELIIPMKIKSELKGLILLGLRQGKIPFSDSDINFISSIASFAVISIENSKLFLQAIEKQKLEKDLEIARNIQQSLLPSALPSLAKFDIAAYNKSAKQIGGDYFDIIPISETKTLIAIADVSGKGVQAALLMANLQAFLKSIARQNLKLAEASNLINDLVSENTSNGSFITFFWGILDEENMEFTYVNMGHNPPLLLSNYKLTKLTVGGMILGVMQSVIPYKSETVKLYKDDLLILFTDGITEAMNIDNEEYSDERLEKLITTQSNFSSADIEMNIILEDVSEFTKDAVQSDDLTIMVVRVK